MSATRIPVIIDTDPGVDDIIAILLALASPELDVLALIVSYGNGDLDSSYTNILKLYAALASSSRLPSFTRSTPILAKGASGPISGDQHAALYFHGRDSLGDITTRYPTLFSPTSDTSPLRTTTESGIDLAHKLIEAYPAQSITWLALGPLTNLYHVAKKDPKMFKDKIGSVVAMGGALDVPGNTTPTAEFNFYADPFAVRELLTSPTPLLPLDRFLLLPLDITTPHELPFPAYISRVDSSFPSTLTEEACAAFLANDASDSVTKFTTSFLQMTRSIMLQFGKDAMELHDIVAVWCAIHNPPRADGGQRPFELGEGWQVEKRVFDIERIGELTRGMLVVDRRIDESLFETGANREEAFSKLDEHHIPAPVERETPPPPPANKAEKGVNVITRTPGPAALLKVLLNRVWDVDV